MAEVIPCGYPTKSRYPERPSCEHGPMVSKGSSWRCKEINRREHRRYREANLEVERERARRWSEANPEYMRRWREARKRAGLCEGCNNLLDLQYDETNCADCRRKRRAYYRRRAIDDKEQQLAELERQLEEIAESIGMTKEELLA